MKGYIHSLESFGTVDGPGVRYVVFFQGCPMRCLYCHNPDTWNITNGTPMEADEILGKFERNRSFYKSGGITATGGEPLFQIDFLTELFTKAKAKGIHTCLDTSGIMYQKEDEKLVKKYESLLAVTDLVMLDIKHMDDTAHKKLTTHSNARVFDFADLLQKKQIPLWIRHVVVPGITDSEEELIALGKYIRTLTNFKHLEVLPYHTMAKAKYENLGMDYPLGDTPELSEEEAKHAREVIEHAMAE